MSGYYPAGRSAESFDNEDVSRETLTDVTVMCRNSGCHRFETTFEVRAIISTIGRHDVGDWVCPGCGTVHEYYEETSE